MLALGAWFAKSALMTSPVGAFLKGIPPGVWKWVGIAALVLGMFLLHQCAAHKALRKADLSGYNRAKAEDQKKLDKAHSDALAWKKQVDASHARIAQLIKDMNDEEARHINRTADDLIVRGPGKARCGQGGNPGLSAAAGGTPRSGQAGAAVDRLPDQERVDIIGLPFNGAVRGGQQHDLCQADLKSWWTWYDQFTKVWPTR
jgi:hypothetical protein